MDLSELQSPRVWIGVGTLTGYLVILAVMTVLLFVVPYVLFVLF